MRLQQWDTNEGLANMPDIFEKVILSIMYCFGKKAKKRDMNNSMIEKTYRKQKMERELERILDNGRIFRYLDFDFDLVLGQIHFIQCYD